MPNKLQPTKFVTTDLLLRSRESWLPATYLAEETKNEQEDKMEGWGHWPVVPLAICALGVGPLYTAISKRYFVATNKKKVNEQLRETGEKVIENEEPEFAGGNGMSEEAFLWCVASNNYEAVLKGLDDGLDVNTRSQEDRCSALFVAAEAGSLEIVELLVKRGARLDLRNQHKSTALFIACHEGREDVAKFLIRHGADVHERCTEQHMSSLFVTALQGEFSLPFLKIIYSFNEQAIPHFCGISFRIFVIAMGYSM